MNPTSDDFKIIVPKETNWNIVFFLSIWLLFWIALMSLLSVMCFQLIRLHQIYDLLLPWFLLLLAGFFFLYIFLWQCFGKEILVFDNDFLVIRKTGTMLERIKKIERKNIIQVDSDADKETVGWIKFWGLAGGKIVIKYRENEIKFGNSLTKPLARQVRFGQSYTESEAKQICQQIRSQINA